MCVWQGGGPLVQVSCTGVAVKTWAGKLLTEAVWALLSVEVKTEVREALNRGKLSTVERSSETWSLLSQKSFLQCRACHCRCVKGHLFSTESN